MTQTGDQGTNLAKVALLNAGWADSVPGMTVKVVSKTSGAVKMESVTELVEFAAK